MNVAGVGTEYHFMYNTKTNRMLAKDESWYELASFSKEMENADSQVQSRLDATLGKNSILVPPELEEKMKHDPELAGRVMENIEKLLAANPFRPGRICSRLIALDENGEIAHYSLTSGGGNITQSSSRTSALSLLLNDEGMTCPYSYLAKNGVIEYNGVTFGCDYLHNAITLGDVTSDPRKVLRIALPSGGCLMVNINNLSDLARAAGMFTPKDLNAILRAIQTYQHCTGKLFEIEEEENEPPEENTAADKNEQERLSYEEFKRRIEMLFEDWEEVKEKLSYVSEEKTI